MAKMSALKMREDYNGKEIKCLIVEDYNTGDIIKYYNPKEFEDIIESTDSMFLTKVYSPSSSEKEEIFKMVEDSISVVDGKAKSEISDVDIVFNLFSKLTDLEIDFENTELMNEIIKNPNELFVAIKLEMDKVLMKVFETYISTYKTLKSNPQSTDLLSKQINQKIALEEKQKNKEKIEELKRQLKELGE